MTDSEERLADSLMAGEPTDCDAVGKGSDGYTLRCFLAAAHDGPHVDGSGTGWQLHNNLIKEESKVRVYHSVIKDSATGEILEDLLQHNYLTKEEQDDDLCVCGGHQCPGYEETRIYCTDKYAINTTPVGKIVERDGNVGELIDGRVDVYGDPVTGFVRHAQVWSGILGHEVQPWQVALCMIGYKLVRTSITPDYSDNSDDVDGYLDIFRQLLGDDMVQARDTAAYLAGGGKGART